MNDQMKLNINLEQTQAVTCNACQNETFNDSVLLRKASRFITQTSQDALIPIPVFTCTKCGHINEEFLPLALKKDKDTGS